MSWKEYLQGWVFGNLILLSGLFIIGQIAFQSSQKILMIGFVEGAWQDVSPAPKAVRK